MKRYQFIGVKAESNLNAIEFWRETPDGKWMLSSAVDEQLAAKEREIEQLKAQVERAEKSCSQLADGVVRYKAQVEQYRNSHADCNFRHVDNSFAEDRFQTYDERCALCKEHDALIASRAAEKGPSNER